MLALNWAMMYPSHGSPLFAFHYRAPYVPRAPVDLAVLRFVPPQYCTAFLGQHGHTEAWKLRLNRRQEVSLRTSDICSMLIDFNHVQPGTSSGHCVSSSACFLCKRKVCLASDSSVRQVDVACRNARVSGTPWVVTRVQMTFKVLSALVVHHMQGLAILLRNEREL